MTMLTIDGLSAYVADEGSGPPMLLVHGFPLDHTMWTEQIRELSPRYRLIAPDLRGFGRSQGTDGTVTMEQFADDLEAMLQALEITEPIILCGLSMGGYIAWQFAKAYPQRLRGLILCDTKAAADDEAAVANRHRVADDVLENGTEPLARAMPQKLFAKSTLDARPHVVEAVREMIRRASPIGVAAASRGMAERPDMTDFLSDIQVPTLLVCGAEDGITPPGEMQQIAALIDGSTCEVIEEAGHMAPMENPHAVNGVIERFLHRL